MENLENHLPLVKSIVYKFDKNLMDSDLYGIGCVALVEASKTYDPNKGSFSTWATRIIKQSIINNFRKNKKEKELKINQDISEVAEKNQYRLPTDVLQVILCDDKFESKKDKENKQILIDHFINNQTWDSIAKKKKITKEGARKKGIAAIKTIRKKYRFVLDEAEPCL